RFYFLLRARLPEGREEKTSLNDHHHIEDSTSVVKTFRLPRRLGAVHWVKYSPGIVQGHYQNPLSADAACPDSEELLRISPRGSGNNEA
ncbi:MAG: hypothetical protein QG577_857, partial [Thermodesulfobacteriota bacterium]|nr:hypothetical protein [Thermodesulfobacteriota bacterium]